MIGLKTKKDWNGKAIINDGPDIIISSDASKIGWGAALGSQKIQGQWTLEERNLHINVLELKAGLFALRSFAQNLRNVHIHLKLDNRTAVAYIQKMGGTRSVQMLPTTQEIWQFCLDREIFLTAEYLPGSLNTEADWQSRNFQDSSDWRLKVSVFKDLDRVLGPFCLDIFASRHNAQTPRYVSWRQDPFSVGVDAFQRNWKEEGLYMFPPFAMIPRCLQKIQQDIATVTLIASPWQSQPWFPVLLSLLVKRPILLPPYKDLLTSPSQGCHPLSNQTKFRLAAWQDIDQGVSKDAAKLLSDFSWRGGTTRAYNSNWGQWTSWCSDRQIDPFRSSMVEVVYYLTERFHSGDNYRTLISRRSAISAFHITIEGEKVGQHPLVCKLLKALFNARPPQPRYVIQWDVDQVVQYIKSLGPNSTLSDKDLSFKVAMLLALASAGRSSELNALDLRYMADKEDVITFTLGKLTKSRKFGSPPLSVSFHALKEDPTLCVVQTIRDYVQRSNLWRKRNVLSKNQLLLSYIEPHKPVVSCTIAGWLIKTLKSAGINTEEFKAHSIWEAATSKAQA